MAYKEFLQDVDVPLEMETQAYIDNFVFGRDQARTFSLGGTTLDLFLVGLACIVSTNQRRE